MDSCFRNAEECIVDNGFFRTEIILILKALILYASFLYFS